MHVLFVSEFWHPYGMGGGEESLHLLACALVRKGVRVSVLTGTYKSSGDETIDGVHIHRVFATASANSFVGNVRRALSFLSSDNTSIVETFVREYGVDVVHCASAHASPPKGVPCVLHVNSPVPFCPKGTLMYQDRSECHFECTPSRFVKCFIKSKQFGKLENKWLYKFNPLVWVGLYGLFLKRFSFLQRYSTFSPNSDFMRVKLVESGVQKGRTFVLPNIVPVVKRSSEKRTVPRIVFAGSLIQSKGVQELLNALVHIKEKCVVDIYGDGHLRKSAESFAKKNSLSFVSFRGQVSNSILLKEFSRADVLVQPSNVAEALPRTVLEGMSAGCVIVTSGYGGSGSVIHQGKNGVVVDISNPVSFAESLDGVLRDGDFRDSLRREALKTLESYREPVVVKKALMVYRSAMNNHKTFKRDIELSPV